MMANSLDGATDGAIQDNFDTYGGLPSIGRAKDSTAVLVFGNADVRTNAPPLQDSYKAKGVDDVRLKPRPPIPKGPKGIPSVPFTANCLN